MPSHAFPRTRRVNLKTLAINTDLQSLADCGVLDHLQIGRKTTRGRSAGGERSLGRKAAEENDEEIARALAGKEIVFIIAGLGGGTGTGAAPVIARKARELGALSMCFVTLPFTFEGDRSKAIAHDGLLEIRRNADVVVTMPNDRLLQIVDANTDMQTAFRVSDEMLCVQIRSIAAMLTRGGLINVDFGSITQMLRSTGGACSCGFGEGAGEDKAELAVASLLESPLLESGQLLKDASAILINVIGGPDLTLQEVQTTMKGVLGASTGDVRSTMGTMIVPEWTGRMAISVLAFEAILDESAEDLVRQAEHVATSSKEEAEARSKSQGGQGFNAKEKQERRADKAQVRFYRQRTLQER